MADELMILPPQSRAARVKRKGHAGNPGRGPEGETCGSCQSYAINEYHGKTWRKCELARANWTHGPGSDIRKKDPACEFWKAKELT